MFLVLILFFSFFLRVWGLSCVASDVFFSCFVPSFVLHRVSFIHVLYFLCFCVALRLLCFLFFFFSLCPVYCLAAFVSCVTCSCFCHCLLCILYCIYLFFVWSHFVVFWMLRWFGSVLLRYVALSCVTLSYISYSCCVTMNRLFFSIFFFLIGGRRTPLCSHSNGGKRYIKKRTEGRVVIMSILEWRQRYH